MLGYDRENKNCGCGRTNKMMDHDCEYTPQGINAAFGYNTASELVEDTNCACVVNQKECCEDRERVREEMICKIKQLNFAIIELGLYLNTHSTDQKALCLHKEYNKEINELKDKYQKIYGPLSIYYPCNKWRWLEEPWPWERGNY